MPHCAPGILWCADCPATRGGVCRFAKGKPMPWKTITIRVKSPSEMRNCYIGDWLEEVPGHRTIDIADTGDDRFNLLIALHEAVEQELCAENGVQESDVSAFDAAFEESGRDGEPGDDPAAPYFREHQAATRVEEMGCLSLGVTWAEYDAGCERAYIAA